MFSSDTLKVGHIAITNSRQCFSDFRIDYVTNNMDRWKLHAGRCHWITTSAAFTAKIAAWRKQAAMGAADHSWHSKASIKKLS